MNDYIATMRKLIGHQLLFTVGCGMIIEDFQGRILLQRRKDENNWGLPGGTMELGETFLETALREMEEETGYLVLNPKLFGIYSGMNSFNEYPNGDKTYSVQIVFFSKEYKGSLKQEGMESWEHQFFAKEFLPELLFPRHRQIIMDWKNSIEIPVIS